MNSVLDANLEFYNKGEVREDPRKHAGARQGIGGSRVLLEGLVD